ncbi:NADH:flavin oxidoreductase (plasmid) [Sphingobium sp. JS3065]|uniref:NADH:flavin oxidoreductase n=1 Tax=Sphingobium sp. JS3065 TaxID=2970925 RepID=UPI002265283F|nr:NADH:flavin oxidoreductase [Sphingobium sp. JS3065]UZW58297.1 NADH:flavin oxidoreductase [Sphingobium sp. JS3065]
MYDTLFTPFDCGSLTLRNRFVMAPMTRFMSNNQRPGPEVAAYYRRRAEHGVGLIITEGATVDHPVSSQSLRAPAFFGQALDGWTRVVEEVHEASAKIVPQLWHVGAMRNPGGEQPNPHLPSATPSGLYRPGSKQIAEPLSKVEIQAIIDSFRRAAVEARRLGFDGVELHGAHGYILDQFLWGALNRRDDEYGGDAIDRTRFIVELVAAIRAEVGNDFPIILRVSQWKQQDYDARLADTPDLLTAIFSPISDAGVDMFHCSQRRYWEPEFPGSHLNFAGWMKRLLNKPVITVGSVGLNGSMVVEADQHDAEVSRDLEPLATGVATGEYDLIAVGRALIADAEWVDKVRTGRLDELHAFSKDHLTSLW